MPDHRRPRCASPSQLVQRLVREKQSRPRLAEPSAPSASSAERLFCVCTCAARRLLTATRSIAKPSLALLHPRGRRPPQALPETQPVRPLRPHGEAPIPARVLNRQRAGIAAAPSIGRVTPFPPPTAHRRRCTICGRCCTWAGVAPRDGEAWLTLVCECMKKGLFTGAHEMSC